VELKRLKMVIYREQEFVDAILRADLSTRELFAELLKMS